eukprot:GEMP01001892.1.p1 GENE.GEMP01001892.1~~GEMP01001892.1.p1  ORF type:complete len:1531 (+),score=392.39 GEMP01001892.1:134-4726(+)
MTDPQRSLKSYRSSTSSFSRYSVPPEGNASSAVCHTIPLHPSHPRSKRHPMRQSSLQSYPVPPIAATPLATVSGTRGLLRRGGPGAAMTGHHAFLPAADGAVVEETAQCDEEVNNGKGIVRRTTRRTYPVRQGSAPASPVTGPPLSSATNVTGREHRATSRHAASPGAHPVVPNNANITDNRGLAPIVPASPGLLPTFSSDENISVDSGPALITHASPVSQPALSSDANTTANRGPAVIAHASPESQPSLLSDVNITANRDPAAIGHVSPVTQSALPNDAKIPGNKRSPAIRHMSPVAQPGRLSDTNITANRGPAAIGHVSQVGIHLQSIPLVPRRVERGERSTSILQPMYSLMQGASLPASPRPVGWDDAVTMGLRPLSASVSSVDSEVHLSLRDTIPECPQSVVASTSAPSSPRRPADGSTSPLAGDVRRATRSPKPRGVAARSACDPDKPHVRTACSHEHAEHWSGAYISGPPLLSTPPPPIAMARNPLPTDPRPLVHPSFHDTGEKFHAREDAPVILRESTATTRAVPAISAVGVKTVPSQSAVVKETVEHHSRTRHSIYDPPGQDSLQQARRPSQNDASCASFRAGHRARFPPRDSTAPGKAPNMFARCRHSEDSFVRPSTPHKERFVASSYDLTLRSAQSCARKGSKAIAASSAPLQYKTPLTSPSTQPPDTTLWRAGMHHVWPLLSISASIACPHRGSRSDLKGEPPSSGSHAAAKVDMTTSPLCVGADTLLPFSHMVPLVSPGTQQPLRSPCAIVVDNVAAAGTNTAPLLSADLHARKPSSPVGTSAVGASHIVTHAAPLVASMVQGATSSPTRTAGGDRARWPSHGHHAGDALLRASTCGMELSARATSSPPTRGGATCSQSASKIAIIPSPMTQPLDDQRVRTQEHIVRHRQPACCPNVPTANNLIRLHAGSDTIERNDHDAAAAQNAPRTVVAQDLYQSTRPSVCDVRHPPQGSSLSQSLGASQGATHDAKATSPYGRRHALQGNMAGQAPRLQSAGSHVRDTCDDGAANRDVHPNFSQPLRHPMAPQVMHGSAVSKNTYDSAPTPSTAAPSLFALHTLVVQSPVQARPPAPTGGHSGCGDLSARQSRLLSSDSMTKSTPIRNTTREYQPHNNAAGAAAGDPLSARSRSPSPGHRGNSQHRHARVVGSPQLQGSPSESHTRAPLPSGVAGSSTHVQDDISGTCHSPGPVSAESTTSHPFFDAGTEIPRLKSAADSGKRVTMALHDRTRVDAGWMDVATVPSLHHAGATGTPVDERNGESPLSRSTGKGVTERKKGSSAACDIRESRVSPIEFSVETHANSTAARPSTGVRREQRSHDAGTSARRSSPSRYPMLGAVVRTDSSLLEVGIGQCSSAKSNSPAVRNSPEEKPSAQSLLRATWSVGASGASSHPVNVGKDMSRLSNNPVNVGMEASRASSTPADITMSIERYDSEESARATTLAIQQQRKEIEGFLNDIRHSENTVSTQATTPNANSVSGGSHEALIQRLDDLSTMCDNIQTKSAEWGNVMEITHKLISETSS